MCRWRRTRPSRWRRTSTGAYWTAERRRAQPGETPKNKNTGPGSTQRTTQTTRTEASRRRCSRRSRPRAGPCAGPYSGRSCPSGSTRAARCPNRTSRTRHSESDLPRRFRKDPRGCSSPSRCCWCTARCSRRVECTSTTVIPGARRTRVSWNVPTHARARVEAGGG